MVEKRWSSKEMPSKGEGAGSRALAILAALKVWLATTAKAAGAATLVVTTTADVLDPADGLCSLREAVIAANTNTPSGGAPGECPAGDADATDTIVLAAGTTYALTTDGAGEDAAVTGDLDAVPNGLDLDLVFTVAGGGTATIAQQAKSDDRVLHVLNGATVEAHGILFTGGSGVLEGGGIRNEGTLTLVGGAVTGNVAGSGGGIYNVGALSLEATEVDGNHAPFDGGGLYNSGGEVMLNNVLIDGNTATSAGGLHNEGGTVTLAGTAVTSNTASEVGGGIANSAGTLYIGNGSTIGAPGAGNTALGGTSFGGGIYNSNGTVTIDASSVSANEALEGGGIYTLAMEASVSIQNGSLVGGEGSGNSGGGIRNAAGSTVTITSSTVSFNSRPFGGGIRNSAALTIDGSVISSNDGGGIFNFGGSAVATLQNGSVVVGNFTDVAGGGVWNQSGATLTLEASTISGNSAAAGVGGGGIFNEIGGIAVVQNGSVISANQALRGGGISNRRGGTVTVVGSTIGGEGAGNAAVDGGGIYNEALAGDDPAIVTLAGSTVSFNSATHSGGGIYNRETLDAQVILVGSTLWGNAAAGEGGHQDPPGDQLAGGGGIFNAGSGWVEIDDSTVAANGATGEGGDGGGILAIGGIWVHSGSRIGLPGAGNTAARDGGGIFSWSAAIFVDGSLVEGNTAGRRGGGIDQRAPGSWLREGTVVRGNAAAEGGGLFVQSLTRLLATTVADNSASGHGGGIYAQALLRISEASQIVGNLAGGEGGAVYLSSSIVDDHRVTGSCIAGNGDTAVFNSQTASQAFTENWWGAPDGPSGAGPGSGDSVGENIDFSGFLAAPPSGCELFITIFADDFESGDFSRWAGQFPASRALRPIREWVSRKAWRADLPGDGRLKVYGSNAEGEKEWVVEIAGDRARIWIWGREAEDWGSRAYRLPPEAESLEVAVLRGDRGWRVEARADGRLLVRSAWRSGPPPDSEVTIERP
jgi:CSLREA domain-containing protein